MDEIWEYLLVPQQPRTSVALRSDGNATRPANAAAPQPSGEPEAIEALHELLRNKALLRALLHLTGTR